MRLRARVGSGALACWLLMVSRRLLWLVGIFAFVFFEALLMFPMSIEGGILRASATFARAAFFAPNGEPSANQVPETDVLELSAISDRVARYQALRTSLDICALGGISQPPLIPAIERHFEGLPSQAGMRNLADPKRR